MGNEKKRNLEEFGEVRGWIVVVEIGRRRKGFAKERVSLSVLLFIFSDVVQEISDAQKGSSDSSHRHFSLSDPSNLAFQYYFALLCLSTSIHFI